MRQLEQRAAEALVWRYFRVLLPIDKAKLRKRYEEVVEQMKPGRTQVITEGGKRVTIHFPGNTKAALQEMQALVKDLLKVKADWLFTPPAHAPRVKREREQTVWSAPVGDEPRTWPRRRHRRNAAAVPVPAAARGMNRRAGELSALQHGDDDEGC